MGFFLYWLMGCKGVGDFLLIEVQPLGYKDCEKADKAKKHYKLKFCKRFKPLRAIRQLSSNKLWLPHLEFYSCVKAFHLISSCNTTTVSRDFLQIHFFTPATLPRSQTWVEGSCLCLNPYISTPQLWINVRFYQEMRS